MVVQAAREGLDEFHQAQIFPKEKQKTIVNARDLARWKNLRENAEKANQDTTIDSNVKKMRIGVIIKDPDGEILASLCVNERWP